MLDTHVRANPVDIRFEHCANAGRFRPIDDDDLPDIPDIAKPPLVTARFLWLPFVSGLLSNAIFWCGPFGFYCGPGLVFALLVVLPWCVCARVHPVGAAVAVALTPVAYFLAVLTLFAGIPGLVAAGAVGAGIMVAPLLLLGPSHARRGLLVAMFVGWAAGLLFIMMCFAYFGLIAIWQWFVGTAMTTALLGKSGPIRSDGWRVFET